MSDNQTPSIDREPSIALMACYFGQLPAYIPLVFRSMGMNPDITWILATDCEPEHDLPPNVTIHRTTMMETANRISEACGFEVDVRSPYDLCSVKPACGLVYQDIFSGFDYWGHIDLDVIFGDLRTFLPDDVLASHDRILCRGHLSIYANRDDVNEAFKLEAPGVTEYGTVFRSLSSRTHQFDEWPGIWKIMRYHGFRQYHDEFIADIKPPSCYRIGRFEAEELENYPHQFFYWHNGKVFQAYYHREGGLFDREVAYVHFQKRHLPAPSADLLTADGFSIGPDGFAPYGRENLSPEEIDQLNPDRRKPLRRILEERIRYYRRGFDKLRKRIF